MNNNKNDSIVALPHFDKVKASDEREIIQIFLSAWTHGRYADDKQNVLHAIYKTADLTGNSDAFIAKTLVDNGLKAQRDSFPQEFLRHVDYLTLGRDQGVLAHITRSYQSLIQFWEALDEAGDLSMAGCMHHHDAPSHALV